MTQSTQPVFPDPVEHLVATLSTICYQQGEVALSILLGNSSVSLVYLEWDGYSGNEHHQWQLNVEVPPARYAEVEDQLDAFEKSVLNKVARITRKYRNHRIADVAIAPQLTAHPSVGSLVPPNHDVERIWGPDVLKVFLSHISKHKKFLGELKGSLRHYGISAFVAHEDIEPTREWQGEIELALRSMDVLVAFLTPDFHESNWTDQEVGWAMGRNIPVFPVRVESDPYGFMGKIQGLNGQLVHPTVCAEVVVEALLRNKRTHERMRKCLVLAFQKVRSWESARTLKGLIVTINDYTEEERTILRNAVTENTKVSEAWGVPDAIYALVGKPVQASAVVEDDLPF